MVLHIAADDKFTEYTISQFSAPEMLSRIVVIPYGGKYQAKPCKNVSIIQYRSPEFQALLKTLGDYSGIVLHGMFWPFCEDIIKAAPKHVKIAWYFWGGEIYSRNEVKLSFIAPITKFLYRLHGLRKSQISPNAWQLPMDLYQRIDYCLTGEHEEYEFAKAYVHNSMDFIWYTCYSIEETIGSLKNERANGNNVLFCNSAAIENNMFDAALWMRRRSYRKHLKNRKVIMPMGYGNPWIVNLMLKWGPRCFDQFEPLMTYMPRKEYNAMMLGCSTLILPYYSPAGQGNIITAMWLGMRVYISEKSIAYNFFKRIGVKIYSFESDFEKYGCDAVPDEEMEYNRKVLREMFSLEHVMQSAKNVVDILEGK